MMSATNKREGHVTQAAPYTGSIGDPIDNTRLCYRIRGGRGRGGKREFIL